MRVTSWESVFWSWAWGALLGALLVLLFGAGCGGREVRYDCGTNKQLCEPANVCCDLSLICGTGDNGCPLGDCCYSPDGNDGPEASTPSLN